MAEGVRRAVAGAEVDICPMADGGEGTVDALVAATGGRMVTRRVTGPLPRMKVDAPIGLLGDGKTAVIEMASASGLHLLATEQRDPLRTTTYGTGELMLAAAELGVRRIVLGIGGSATIDGGIGAAQAWGARFILKTGQTHAAGDRRLTGSDLNNLLRLETSGGGTPLARRRTLPAPQAGADSARAAAAGTTSHAEPAPPLLETRGIEFVVACDVGNPLFGADGAAAVFGPQKGATAEQVRALDTGLRHLARLVNRIPLADTPGAGAAGGLGFGMLAFFGATLQSGVEIVMNATRLRERLAGADLCLTGEGRLDAQTAAGKTVWGVARASRDASVPCVALAGGLGGSVDALRADGLTAAFAIADGPTGLEDSVARARELIVARTEEIVRVFIARGRR